MAVKKIPCGGFYYDDETVSFNGDVMTVVGGGNVPDPEVADIGKVLGIVEDGAGAKYAPVADGGLPDPSALSDGMAMVAVNGEWKMQDGYGYTVDPAFEPITWDGDTEGRDTATANGNILAYKVSDVILTAELLNGASAMNNLGDIGGVEVYDEVTSFLMADALAGDVPCTIISGTAGEYSEGGTIVIPSDGTYFSNMYGYYLASLAAPSVHQFDPAFIPAVIPAAPSEDGTYVLTCTITDGEVVYSWETNE